MENKKNKKVIKIDIGIVDRPWYYSSNPRIEGLLKLLPYIKWTNITEEEYHNYKILLQIDKNKEMMKNRNKCNRNGFYRH